MGRGKADKSAYAKARPYFIKARHLDELDPRPAIGYYLSFREAGEAFRAAPVTPHKQAYPDASFNPQNRLLTTRQLLDTGQANLAPTAMPPTDFTAHEVMEQNLDRTKTLLHSSPYS